MFDIETFEIRSKGFFRVCIPKCATCWKRLQVAKKSSDNTQLSFYSSTLTSHSCAAKLLKQSKEEEADDRSQQWSTQFKSLHFAAIIHEVFSNGEFVKAKIIQVTASRFVRYEELVFAVFPAGLQMILVENYFAFI
jgi:hypothetical protein